MRFSSDLHKVLLKSNAGVESTYVALNGFETVGAKQCRLGCSHESVVQLCCEVEGEAEGSDWSNRKNEDTEDRREMIIRDEDDKDQLAVCLLALLASVSDSVPQQSLHAKRNVSQV